MSARQSLLLSRTILLRLLGVAMILVVISFLTFALMYLAPGDLVKNLLGNRPSSPEAIAAIRAQYHLDDPFLVQYWEWLKGVLHGDFGTSIRMQQPVTQVLADRAPVTILLIVLSFVVAVAASVPLGILSATRRGSALDRIASAVTLTGLSAPSFALAILGIYVFAMIIPIFPAFGSGRGFWDQLWHMILPSLVLAAGIGAILMRMTRAALIRELDGDAITFARARGLSGRTVRQIALRGALIPIVTSAGLILTFIIGGTIIVETIFALPGIGQLLEESVLFKDLPTVQAVTLLVAAAIGLVTVIVDLSYLVFDPRVRTRELNR
jgi:peptide/nickel transport system permease protein